MGEPRLGGAYDTTGAGTGRASTWSKSGGDAEDHHVPKASSQYDRWYNVWLGKAYSMHFSDFSKLPQRADSKGFTPLDYYQSLALELSRCPLDLEREEEWIAWAESKVAAKLKELTIHSSRVSEYRKVRGANS